tara:strand:- start:1414 stop:1524 length:111 start_codon:yes stop_codon:yes gene_type:complete
METYLETCNSVDKIEPFKETGSLMGSFLTLNSKGDK